MLGDMIMTNDQEGKKRKINKSEPKLIGELNYYLEIGGKNHQNQKPFK